MNFFITGISRGFGKELALHYLKLGHKVYGISRTEIQHDEEKTGIIGKENFKYFKGSVNNENDVDMAINNAVEFMGGIDILINNAAYKLFNMPDKITNLEYEESIKTNLISPIFICQKIIPIFLKQGSGSIINIASNAGMVSYKEGTAYCTSKAGLISYSLSLSDYLKDKKISVNVISPPTFTTEDYKKYYPDINHDKLLKSENVIKVIDSILFNKKFITGENFPMFKFKTSLHYILKKNIEFLKYLFQLR